jgi:hypothetical protein
MIKKSALPIATFLAVVLAIASPGANAQASKAASAAKPPPPYLVDIAWGAQGQFSMDKNIAPGKFVEACGKLDAGAKVAWRFEANAATDFNIHYHVGKDVVYPAQLRQTQGAQDELLVSLAQDYCWMWTNKGAAAVRLQATLGKTQATK